MPLQLRVIRPDTLCPTRITTAPLFAAYCSAVFITTVPDLSTAKRERNTLPTWPKMQAMAGAWTMEALGPGEDSDYATLSKVAC